MSPIRGKRRRHGGDSMRTAPRGVEPLPALARWSQAPLDAEQTTCTATHTFPDVERVLLVRQDRLGDFILTVPAIERFRSVFPSAQLGVVVRPSVAALARCIEGVDEVLDCSPEAPQVAAAIARFRPDLVVCISREKESAWAARISRAKYRLGSGRRFFSPLFTHRVEESRRETDRHELEFALTFAHAAGAEPTEARFPIKLPGISVQAADAWLEEHQLDQPVLIHPGSGGSCPRWPLEHYIALGERLVEHKIPICWSLGPAERSMGRALDKSSLAGTPRFEGGVEEFAHILQHTRLLLSNSTAPIHLAAAMGAQSIALHAPWRSCGVRRWGPYDARSWAVTAHNEEVLNWTRRQRERGGWALMSGLEVEAVFAGVQRILRGEAPSDA